MIRTRKEHPEFGLGEWNLVETGESSALALRAQWMGSTSVAVHNFSERPCKVRLDVPDGQSQHLVDALYGDSFPVSDEAVCEISLEGYGFYWLKLSAAAPGPKFTPDKRPARNKR